MKILFLVILSIVVFYCINRRVINESADISDIEKRDIFIAKLTEQEFLTGRKNDTVFLNLTFGMDEKEVLGKMKSLKKINILENISSFQGILKADYTLSYSDYLNSGRIYLFFNNNKLHEMQIDTTDYNMGKLKALFIQKYGEYDYSTTIDGIEETHWVNGNRHITFIEKFSNKNILIRYLDTTGHIMEKTNVLIKYAGRENIICC